MYLDKVSDNNSYYDGYLYKGYGKGSFTDILKLNKELAVKVLNVFMNWIKMKDINYIENYEFYKKYIIPVISDFDLILYQYKNNNFFRKETYKANRLKTFDPSLYNILKALCSDIKIFLKFS